VWGERCGVAIRSNGDTAATAGIQGVGRNARVLLPEPASQDLPGDAAYSTPDDRCCRYVRARTDGDVFGAGGVQRPLSRISIERRPIHASASPTGCGRSQRRQPTGDKLRDIPDGGERKGGEQDCACGAKRCRAPYSAPCPTPPPARPGVCASRIAPTVRSSRLPRSSHIPDRQALSLCRTARRPRRPRRRISPPSPARRRETGPLSAGRSGSSECATGAMRRSAARRAASIPPAGTRQGLAAPMSAGASCER